MAKDNVMSETKEQVIERLHEENQRLRDRGKYVFDKPITGR